MDDARPPARSPHDALFRGTFEQPALAAELFRQLVPAELAESIDWNTLAVQPGSFVDETLRWRHTDLLFSARCGDRPVLMYLLVEHQSTEKPPPMPLRLLLYMARVLERYVRAHPDTRSVPAVVPVVVSHAPRPWTESTEMLDTFDMPSDAARSAAAPFLPKFRFILEDLSAQTDEALEARRLSPEAKLTFLALRHARVKRFASLLKRWAGYLGQLYLGPGGRTKAERFCRYILDVGEDPPEDLRDVLRQELGPEPGALIMGTAERLRQQGIEQGIEQGIAQGRQQGRVQGQAKALLIGLERRFSPLPPDIVQRLNGATEAQLERWLAAAFSATSLDEVFAE